MAVKLLIALQADDTILIQISDNEKALAHVNVDRPQALAIAKDLQNLAHRIPDKPVH